MARREYTPQELLELDHNDHRAAFLHYLSGNRHIRDKQEFLFRWIDPHDQDMILECGSSSGKTCVDLTRRSGCRALGIDFDPEAVEVSTQMRDEHFPQLADRCRFQQGDLGRMDFDPAVTKVLMPDFTEHVPDAILGGILDNIRRQLPGVRLYVYTPCRSHLFERLKHRNLILKNPGGHINVKTERELKAFLQSRGWRIVESRWRGSHLPVFRVVEGLLGRLPLLGSLFHRRIAIIATPTGAPPRLGDRTAPLPGGG